MNSSKVKPTDSLSNQQRVLLLQSISQFFEKNGFSKTLKNFLKEAQVQKIDGDNCSLNIEEMCYEYLKSRDSTKEEVIEEKVIDKKSVVKTKEKENGIVENGVVDGSDVKLKKSKKKKSGKDGSDQITEETRSKPAEVPDQTNSVLPSEPSKKSKDKKKKHVEESKGLVEDLPEKQIEVAVINGEKKEKKAKKEKKEKKVKKDDESEGNAVEETKETNKRKRSSSDDGADQVEEEEEEEAPVNDSKLRKIDDSDKSNGIVQSAKKLKGSLNGSAEPKTAKAFQRVKPEDVEFADERLQDNSYWAKDGADSGYGAKAQEVLGQVRGRDFRHEKTKKKRGSYRGGQIDLNTHSVKFNYGDDDE